LEDDINALIDNMKELLQETAPEVLGKIRRGAHPGSLMTFCLCVINEGT